MKKKDLPLLLWGQCNARFTSNNKLPSTTTTVVHKRAIDKKLQTTFSHSRYFPFGVLESGKRQRLPSRRLDHPTGFRRGESRPESTPNDDGTQQEEQQLSRLSGRYFLPGKKKSFYSNLKHLLFICLSDFSARHASNWFLLQKIDWVRSRVW